MAPANKDGFHFRDKTLYADDIPLPPLAAEYGTPTYVYSASVIRRNIASLRKALGDDVLIAYACKANTNVAILSMMARHGLGADVVSGGELLRSIRAGISPAKIVFSGVGKTDKELMLAIDSNIAQINVESGAEIDRIIALSPKRQVRLAFRLNPDVAADTHAKISTGHGASKFGMPADEILSHYKTLQNHPTICPVGLSLHIGSQMTTLDPLRDAFHILADLVRRCPLPVETIDFGGGLGIVYTDETPVDVDGYGKLIDSILRPLGARLITEPGRFLVGNAGILLTRITHVKITPNHPILIIDGGMNDLMRPALYDAVHRIEQVVEKNGSHQICDVVGPVCESSDVFLRDVTMTNPARDDLVALMNAGAYGLSMAGTYNSRPMAAEVLVDGNKHGIIRERQTLDDITKDERIPGWLTA